jgi:hypothetical protein
LLSFEFEGCALIVFSPVNQPDYALTLEMEGLKDYFQSAPATITNPELILNAAFKIEKVHWGCWLDCSLFLSFFCFVGFLCCCCCCCFLVCLLVGFFIFIFGLFVFPSSFVFHL